MRAVSKPLMNCASVAPDWEPWGRGVGAVERAEPTMPREGGATLWRLRIAETQEEVKPNGSKIMPFGSRRRIPYRTPWGEPHAYSLIRTHPVPVVWSRADL